MKTKLKLVDKKTIVVPFVASILVFIILGRIVIQSVNDHYEQHAEESANNLAKGYASSIEKLFESEEVIDQLLEDKLLLAGKTTGIYASVSDRESLLTVAKQLSVDEINIYDMEGNLMLTTMPDIDTWQPPTDHPVQVFIKKGLETYVEDIRENAVTGLLYKYGYFKKANEYVIQIGISAEAINNLLTQINLSAILSEMSEQYEISFASFMNDHHVVTSSTQDMYVGQSPVDQDVVLKLSMQKPFGHINHLNEHVYEFYHPVNLSETFVGTLVIGYSMIHQKQTINYLIAIGFLILLIVFLMIIYVITMNYRKNKKLAMSAYYDALTGLPNEKYLQLTFAQLKEELPKPFSFILVNVHEFRHINMTYGYEVGDAVIQDVGHRLSTMQRNHTSVFRLNSDRFILLETKNVSPHKLEIMAKHICMLFSRPFVFDHISKQLHTRVGALQVEDKNTSLSQAIQHTLITLDHHPDDTQCFFSMYNQEIVDKIQREETILTELQEIVQGINRERLSIVLQPQYHVISDRIVGFEALARLNSASYGHISPVEFIAIAEKHHVIYPIGEIILQLAAQFIQTLIKENIHDVRVAINVSVMQLMYAGFYDLIMDTLDTYRISTNHLEIEITESVFMKDAQDANEILKRLRQAGILISLDDFGTGFSSFYRLRNLEVDILKIDRSFVSAITKFSKESLISEEMIRMAHKMNLQVVAEGVELEGEYQYLIDHKCDIIQGYYYAKPLPALMAVAFAIERNRK